MAVAVRSWQRRAVLNWQTYFGNLADSPLVLLEIGVFNGQSACWFLDHFLTHPESRYIGIDSWNFQSRRFNATQVEALARANLAPYADKVELRRGASQAILRESIWQLNSIDLGYIDGDHHSSAVLTDSVLLWPLIKPGGLLVWDDYAMCRRAAGVRRAVDAFLNCIPGEFQLLFQNSQIGIRRLPTRSDPAIPSPVPRETSMRLMPVVSQRKGVKPLKNTALLQRFSALASLDHLEDLLINEVGTLCREYQLGGHNLRAVQNPYEMAAYLRFLASVAHEITSYLEIGVSSGGMYFTVDSFLRALNPHFKRSLALDNKSRILRYNYAAYHAAYPTSEFVKMSSREFEPNEDYDLCFIDANHSYHMVKADFELVRDRCKFIAFHDIALLGAGVPLLWRELRAQYEYREIIDRRVSKTIGIGILDMRT